LLATGQNQKAIMHPWLAGVDGCTKGWLVALVRPAGTQVRICVVQHFADLIHLPEDPVVIAVDMPIGLPARAGYGGRQAETAVRALLGARCSSVFSIPSRQAVFAETGPFGDGRSRYAAHRRACTIAQATSDPPRRITIQAFGIFEKIREVDTLLRSDRSLTERVFETHPEVVFWRLNGDCALSEPKKKKGRAYEPGLLLRRRLLIREGLPIEVVEAPPPPGAGRDDLLDALACAALARRIYKDVAHSFPDPPGRDEFGLPMAIWA